MKTSPKNYNIEKHDQNKTVEKQLYITLAFYGVLIHSHPSFSEEVDQEDDELRNIQFYYSFGIFT